MTVAQQLYWRALSANEQDYLVKNHHGNASETTYKHVYGFV
jgi:hypothetical protein